MPRDDLRHDARGDCTGAAGGTWRNDTRKMLVGADAPGMAATYGYYPEGGRAWKQVNDVTTLYRELDGIGWGAYDPAGNLKERTIRASGTGGVVVAVHSPTGGLIRLLPNRQAGVIGWRYPDGKLGEALSCIRQMSPRGVDQLVTAVDPRMYPSVRPNSAAMEDVMGRSAFDPGAKGN